MTAVGRTQKTGLVLLTLASGQFVMTLDSSVMNVSIATVAKDVGTTVTGIQTAITLYTLVMAMLMIPGGKVGSLIGRKRAFSIGCVIYGAGSLTTAFAPNLTVLIIGWSLLEGIGAALILPAIVALVAGNFPPEGRPRAYGLVMSAGAIAVAVGPLIGGLATTYASWRWVFVGEVVIVAAILVLARRVQDAPVETRTHFDLIGAGLSAAGLGVAVFGVLRSSLWGWVLPKPGGPAILGLSPTIVLIFLGLFVLWVFGVWEHHVEERRLEPLVRLSMFGNRQFTGGLLMFFFQFLVQAGLLAMFAGIVWLFMNIDVNAGAEIVTVPLLLAGLGIGALASQLGSVTVSAVSDDQSPAVGGLQNTATNLGASIGTALAGSLLIAALTASFLNGIEQNPAVPPQVATQANVELAGGIPFISDADLDAALTQAGVDPALSQAVLDENEQARLDGLRTALAALALIALIGLFFSGRIPKQQPGSMPRGAEGSPVAR